jgi:hypothetical protein
MNVFISYSHTDNVFVQQLARLLDEKRIPYFLDRKSIEWGDDIPQSIEDGLGTASHLIVVVSPASLKSSWVPYEIGMARAKGARILPLLTHPSLDLPGFIANLSYKVSLENLVDFFDEDIRRGSTLKLMLEVGHMNLFNSGQMFGVKKLEIDEDKNLPDWLPYYRLLVKNVGIKPVATSHPVFEFKEKQTIMGKDEDYHEIGFEIDYGEQDFQTLRPQGERSFKSTTTIACTATQGFLDNNIKRIYLKDDQGFESEVSNTQMELAKNYCQRFFSSTDLLEVLTAQRSKNNI